MLKRISFIFIVSLLFISTAFIPAIEAREYFEDLRKGDSHYTSIHTLVSANIVSGYTLKDNKREFRPNQHLSRAHGAVLLTRALDLPIPSDVDSVLKKYSKEYKDLIKHDYADQIAAVTEANIFGGSGGKFNPSGSLTRQQMATVLVKAFNLKDTVKRQKVNLKSVDPSHRKNVQIFANLGITNQLENFRPNDPATRGHFATFLYRTMTAKCVLPLTDNSWEVGTITKDMTREAIFEVEVARLTNKERMSCGLDALKLDEQLSQVARAKSRDMLQNDYFAHKSPVYGDFGDLLKFYNVPYRSAAENIAMGHRDPEEVVEAWMNSPGHRSNILEEKFTHIGVGYVDDRRHWTQHFVRR